MNLKKKTSLILMDWREYFVGFVSHSSPSKLELDNDEQIKLMPKLWRNLGVVEN